MSLTSGEETKENLDITSILNDKRVRVELMDLPTLRLALWWREGKLRDRLRAIEQMNLISRQELGQRIETWQTSTYGLLLAFILIKKRSGQELIDWMIEQNNDDFQIAAAAILTNESVSEELVPIEALLLCALYPTVRFSELSSYIRRQTASPEIIRDSEVLVALYLGLSGIQLREQATRP